MARGYTVATVALTLKTSAKWVDNVLSHHAIPGVTQSRQGIARKVTAEGVFQLAVIHRLTESLRMPIPLALEGARVLSQFDEWEVGSGLSFQLDRILAGELLQQRLDAAVEAAPLPRRGRPPGKAKRGA